MTVRQFRRLEIGLIWWIGNPNTVMVWYPRYFGSQIRRLRHQGSAGILREYSSAGTEFNGQTLTCRKDCSRIPISSRNFFLARKTIIPKHPAGRQTTDHCVTFPMLGSKCGRRALNCEMVTSRHGQNGHESRLFSNLYNVKQSWLVTTFATTVAWFQTAWFNFPSPKSPGLVNLTDYTSFIYKTTQSSKIPII